VSIVPPPNGISLLNTKSEILLSYLQNLVFLVLLQVRQLSASAATENGAANGVHGDTTSLQLEVAQKLTQLRVYLEKGARPLEGRLKYQLDKVLKAAEDSQRMQQQQTNDKSVKSRQRSDESEDEDASGSEEEIDQDEEAEDDQDVDELAYRPNLAAFARPDKEAAKPSAKSTTNADGIYRPPKIKPTALPQSDPDRRGDREARRRPKSRVIDEFVQAELSAAPLAEASIGSTIQAGGRIVKTKFDREKEAERRAYEENNFVRLPKESKKERAKRGTTNRAGYGGEDFRDLGRDADRIGRLTRRRNDGGSLLERSRKRRATEDGPRGDGHQVGESFEKRRKKVAGWKR
jgi:U3 small nucleolar ribonucleoprotein protein LCP5